MRLPTSPVGTSRPSSSTILASKAGVTSPLLPALARPGRLARKSWVASVEPTTSSNSKPVRSFQWLNSAGGNGSPEDKQMRNELRSYFFSIRRKRAKSVGTEKKKVGLYFSITWRIFSGSGFSGQSTVDAPKRKGKYRELPRP